jgi:hypothetical protein
VSLLSELVSALSSGLEWPNKAERHDNYASWLGEVVRVINTECTLRHMQNAEYASEGDFIRHMSAEMNRLRENAPNIHGFIEKSYSNPKMSGVTEVGLYRNAIDTVPTSYPNVIAAVLNSSTKDHATGIKRYLDGAATVSGLDPGTHYFWVELIDARGNTAWPQPAGSYTTPTVWEFSIVSNTNHPKVLMYSIESDFGATPENLTFGPDWLEYMPENNTKNLTKEELASKVSNRPHLMCNSVVERPLWPAIDYDSGSSATFTVTWNRPKHTPGVSIRRNGETVFTDTIDKGGDKEPNMFVVEYHVG